MTKQTHKLDIDKRCLGFVISVIQLTKLFPKETASFVLTRELIRSAGSIGANVVEGGVAHTKKEFINFMSIARKSAYETNYWLVVILNTYPRYKKKLDGLITECNEICKILSTIILNAKNK